MRGMVSTSKIERSLRTQKLVFNTPTCSATFTSLRSKTKEIAYSSLPLDIAMIESSTQQPHPEILRRIEVLEDKFEKRIRSLETRLEGRVDSLEGRVSRLDDRLHLLDRRIGNLDGRIIRSDGRITRSDERIDNMGSQRVKTLDDSEKRIKQLEDRLDNVGVHREKSLEKSDRDLKSTLGIL